MMTDISLRAYNREIEGLIEGNQIEEAIAHSRHILERFPKHVATYRLLGKAYLEVQRYSDAEDVLQRVLSCIPDDFIAHVGMSIIREDASGLEEAIWHMERAFDVQPSNAAIQAELRRLYGQRDGTPPIKVSLTRGALARMSARSHLYSQAIGELRAILAEDPQRPDLQVVLARLYFQTGQRNIAVETCSALLNRLPNCLEANRIMAEVLPSTERASEASYYKQRVEAIDPYRAHVSPDYPAAEQVPDEAVMLDRLVIGVTAELAPERARPASAEPPLAEPEATAPTIAESTSAAEQEVPAETGTPGEELPDWMHAAGWVAVTESIQEPPVEPEPFVEETPQESEIPEWLRSLAPEGQPVPPEEMEAPGETDLPDWLAGTAAAAAGLGVAAALSEDDESEAQPEEKLAEEVAAGESEAFTAEVEAAATDEIIQEEPETLPDWLAGVQVADAGAALEESPKPDDELPDWLAGTQAAGVAGTVGLGAAALIASQEEEQDLAEEGLGEESEAQAVEEASLEAEGVAVESAALSSESGAAGPGEALPEEPEGVAEWLAEGGSAVVAGETLLEESLEEQEPAVGEPEEAGQLLAEESLVEAEVEAEEEGVPAWLQELSPPETLETPVEEESQPSGETLVEPPLAAEASSLAFLASLAPEDTGESGLAAETAEAASPAEIEDTTPDWLKELAGEPETQAPHGVKAFEDQPEGRETVPDWLRAISGEALESEAAPAEAGETTDEEAVQPAEEEVPGWLQAAMAAGAVGVAGEILAERPAKVEAAEPPQIEGDTRPVRLFEEAAEETFETTPETVSADEEMPFLAEDQESTYAWLQGLSAEDQAAVEEAEVSAEEPLLEEAVWEAGPVEETREEPAPPWLGLAGAVAAGTALGELDGKPEEVEEAPLLEEETAPAGASGSLADVLAAAGAVYAADRMLDEEQPSAEVEAGVEKPAAEELPVAAAGAEVYEWLEEPPAAPQETQPAEEISLAPQKASDELPEWLREYATAEPTPAADVEETEWFASAAATGLLDAAKLPEHAPEGLLDLNAASQAQLERLPSVGFILAQNIVTYREQHGPFTSLDQLGQVPGITPETVEELRLRLILTVVPESQSPASEVPELSQAWQSLSVGDIPAAVARYVSLIRHEQQLDEVIREVQQALALHPAESSLYQALGDALARAGRLQEALEAYDRAEDLLR